jgi:UDP-N-acetylglucosamine--N-acetylmuramyl-(pentapeptide) pyrophosphoryl-undecaprenol N-acetylglucosamine transferase
MTIVIAAGGTGGHLYPAVALARAFLEKDPATTILFVGTARGLELKVLAHEGFELVLIAPRGQGGRPRAAPDSLPPVGQFKIVRDGAQSRLGVGG